MVLKELIFNSFYIGHLERLILTELILWCGLERTDFNSSYIWEGVVVFKELIFNSFYYWEVVVVLKELILTVSTLGGCGGLERTDF